MKTAEKASLKLFLLGRPQVFIDGAPVTGFVSEKALALLCYLVLSERPLGRDTLAGLLWGEMPDERARANLRMALYNLQRLLPGYFRVTRLEVAFDRAKDVWLDVKEFESLLADQEHRSHKSIVHPPADGDLPHIISDLYRGDFLEGLFVEASPEFEDWIIIKRERMRQMAVGYFHALAEGYIRQGDYASALLFLQRLLALAPWHENAHQNMMLALARTGEYTSALRQYDICRRSLFEHLGVDPMPETTRLYKHILAARDLSSRHNLPLLPYPLLGREVELNQLARLLAAPENRLITMVGPGGVGKTSLAISAARAKVNEYLDGVFFIPLASLSDPAYLPITIGNVLGLKFSGKQKPEEQLLNALKEREILLVLDNFEHLMDGVGLVADLLQAARSLKILVTSRERLNLKEEIILDIEGLTYPVEDTDEAWKVYPAIRLFAENAQRTNNKFLLREEDRFVLIQVCRLVEGLPLALEMASAWTDRMSCAEIANKIESSLSFLETSFRNVPERHRSITAVFDHSWNLISKQEREVLSRLAIFRGGFTEEAAWQVAEASDEIIQNLVHKSLLRRVSIPGGHPRYGFHELIRQYAYERLEEAKEEQRLTLRHLKYFVQMVEAARPELHREKQALWMERLQREDDNFQAGLERSIRGRLENWGLRLAAGLVDYWIRRGLLQDGRSWLECLLFGWESSGLSTDLPDDIFLNRNSLDGSTNLLKIQALRGIGEIASEQGDLNQAEMYHHLSLRLARELGDSDAEAQALAGLGTVAWKLAYYSRARSYYDESLRIFRQINNWHGKADVIRRLGSVSRLLGEDDRAHSCYQEALGLFSENGDLRGIALALEGLGLVARAQGDLGQARSIYEKSLALRRSIDDRIGIAYSLMNLGATALKQGDMEQAQFYLEESLRLRREFGDQVGIAAAINALGDVALDKGDVEYARSLLEESLKIRRSIGEKYGMVDDLQGLGDVFLRENNFAKARACYEERLALSEELGVPRLIWAAQRDLEQLKSTQQNVHLEK